MNDLNWRDMFCRYANTVNECEGVFFLYPGDWSEEEQAAIKELMGLEYM